MSYKDQFSNPNFNIIHAMENLARLEDEKRKPFKQMKNFIKTLAETADALYYKVSELEEKFDSQKEVA